MGAANPAIQTNGSSVSTLGIQPGWVLSLDSNLSPNWRPQTTVPSSSTGTLFDVTDPVYGAKGDGTTDDTPSIQSAINAAGVAAANVSFGGQRSVVLFPPTANGYKLHYTINRQYSYSYCLLLPSNVELVGQGRPRLIGDAHGQTHKGNGNSIVLGNGSVFNVAVKGLMFDGGYRDDEISSGLAFPDGTEDFFGINAGDITDFEITDCLFTGVYGDAVRVGDTRSVRGIIHHNTVTVTNGQFINVISSDNVIVESNILHDNQAFKKGGSESVPVNNPVGMVIVSNNIVDNGGTLEVTNPGSGSHTIFSGNSVAPNLGAQQGIYIRQGVAVGNIVDMNRNGLTTQAGLRTSMSSTTGNLIRVADNSRTAQGINTTLGSGHNNIVANQVLPAEGAVTPIVSGVTDQVSANVTS